MLPEYYYEYNRDDTDYFNTGNVYCNEHFHKAIEILFCISGEKETIVDGERYLLKSGEILFVPPFSVHQYIYNQNGGECLCLVLPVSYSDVYNRKTDGRRFENIVFKGEQKTADIYNHLKLLTEADELLKEGIYCYIISRLIKDIPLSNRKITTEKAFAVRALNYINEHFFEDIDLQTVAKALGYSRCYFSSMFNKHFHMSFSLFLNNVRISRSIPMLRGDTVANVSRSVGFNNVQSYFQNFKRVTGTTPKSYIKEHVK